MDMRMTGRKHRLALYIEKMKGLSPLEKLSQGYSYVQGKEGNVRRIGQVSKGDPITIYVTDGTIRAEVKSVSRITYPDTRNGQTEES